MRSNRSRPRCGRKHSRRHGALRIAVLAACSLGCASARAADTGVSDPIVVTVAPENVAAERVDPAQQGFSLESEELVNPNFTSRAFFGFLQTLGKSGVVRIGGNSVDEQLWTESDETFASVGGTWPVNRRANATIVRPANIQALADAVRGTGWRINFGLDLRHFDPARAARQAAFTAAALGSSLEGFAIGNEANYYVADGAAYYRSFSTYAQAIRATVPQARLIASEMGSGAGTGGQKTFAHAFAKMLRPTIPDYDSRYDAAIEGVQPRSASAEAPVSRPAIVSASPVDPVAADVTDSKSPISAFTAHWYPESACSAKTAPRSAAQMLSAATHAAVAGKVSWLADEARLLGVPAYLDETNTVNCQGSSGISNSYATALYALDLLLISAQKGLAEVDLHSTIGPCGGTVAGDPGHTGGYYLYTPFCYASRDAERQARGTGRPDLVAQPILFGAKLFRELGTGRFVQTTLSDADALRAYAITSGPGELKIVLIDTRDPATTASASEVTLRPGFDHGAGTATVLKTTSASGLSTTDPSAMTFGGSRITNTGAWSHAPVSDGVRWDRGAVRLSLAPGTATILSLHAGR